MPELAPVVSSELASYYEGVRDNVHELLAPLSTEQLWKKPYPYGNSIGHLLLHLTGNLSHYIGARIASTGYVRNRPLEFSDASKRSKDQVLADFDAAISMVASTIRKQSAQDLVAPYADRPIRARTRVSARSCAWPRMRIITSGRSSISRRSSPGRILEQRFSLAPPGGHIHGIELECSRAVAGK